MHAWASAAQRSTGGRVTRAETIHLTLAFLGEVEEARVPALMEFSFEAERHVLPIEQTRYWPRSRIVWAGPLETPEGLLSLFGQLKEQLQSRKFKFERRPFAAHITLIRKAWEPGDLPDLPAVDWPVAEVALVRSRLAPDGPRYDIIRRFALP